jgi:hypothetical protein
MGTVCHSVMFPENYSLSPYLKLGPDASAVDNSSI